MDEPAERHEVICAWCGVLVAPGRQPASHGLCAACLIDLTREFDERTLAKSASSDDPGAEEQR